MPRVLMVTIAIGGRYLDRYKTLFHENHLSYCRLHGYEFRLCDAFLEPGQDDSSLVSMQKFLVCSQPWSRDFDFVVFVDADILTNLRTAPAIHAAADYGGLIGVVDEYSQPSPSERRQIQERAGWESTAREYYALAGYDIETDKVLNSGVLVMQPAKHREFLDRAYEASKDRAKGHPRGFHFEQASLGWHLQTQKRFMEIDNRWNAIYMLQLLSDRPDKSLQSFHRENFFTHFAGGSDRGIETQIRSLATIPRNEACPCGSGRRFKHCHGAIH